MTLTTQFWFHLSENLSLSQNQDDFRIDRQDIQIGIITSFISQ